MVTHTHITSGSNSNGSDNVGGDKEVRKHGEYFFIKLPSLEMKVFYVHIE